LFKRWYQSSLRNQILIWLLAINFIILILMAGGALLVSRSAVEKNIYEQLEREHVVEAELIESYLNHLVAEMRLLGANPALLNVINGSNQADGLLGPILNRHPLLHEGRNDFYLLDANLNRVYSVGDHLSWVSGSNVLARKALTQHQTQAALLITDEGYELQIAQPIESRGVFVVTEPINQLMGSFFQGRKDIAAWVLEDGSGHILSTLHGDAGIGQKMVGELLGDPRRDLRALSPSPKDQKEPVWKSIKGALRLVPPLADLHLQLILNERTNWADIVAVELVPPFIAVLLFICLVAFLVITFAGRSLATPLEDLTSYMLKIGEAGFSQSISQPKLASLSHRHDEVGRLSAQFSLMLDRLRQGYVGLEDQVAQRNAQLDTIFVLSPDGFIEVDAAGEVGYVNPAFETLTGLVALEVVGQPLTDLVEKLRTLTKDFSIAQVHRLFKASEQVHWLALERPFRRTLALLTKVNQANGLVVYIRDVTQEADLEEMRTTFMSTAAHELRTPISSILGYAELLMRRLKSGTKPSEGMIEEMAAVIERQSKNMADLVNDLLDLSRLEHQIAKGFDLHETSLATYLRPVVSQFQMHGDARDVVMYIDDHLPNVRLHPESFKRLIVNLLSNAFKYSPKGSPVIVKTFTKTLDGQQYVGVSIQDHGTGMSAEDLEHVFERFYRSGAHAQISGTGLGLAIAKEIMQAHSGQIQMQSTLNEGSTVVLLFPSVRKWGAGQ